MGHVTDGDDVPAGNPQDTTPAEGRAALPPPGDEVASPDAPDPFPDPAAELPPEPLELDSPPDAVDLDVDTPTDADVPGPPVDPRPRRAISLGGLAVGDRRRLALGIATAVVLAIAAVLGVRLVDALAGAEGGDEAREPVPGVVGGLVPSVFALAEPPAGPGAPEVVAALSAGRNDVAVDTVVDALCATVALDGPAEVAGRWERDGEEVAATEPAPLDAPGFADCIDADGEALPDGAYQFVVTGEDGATSAPGTLVVGAPVVAQTFVNDTDGRLCGLRVAPLRAGYFTWFDATASPIERGASVTVPLAGVRHVVEAVGCDDAEVVASSRTMPDATRVRSLGG